MSDGVDYLLLPIDIHLGTLLFEVIRDAPSDVYAQDRLPFATALNLPDAGVVDNGVTNDILANQLSLLSHDILSALARRHELKACVVVLAQIVEVGEDPVCHEHRHLDLLHEAAAAFVVRARHHRYFFIDFLRDSSNIVSVRFVHINGHARDERFGHREHLVVILSLPSLESESVLLAHLCHASELVPTLQKAIGEGNQVVSDPKTALRVVVVDKQVVFRASLLAN